MLQSEKSQGTVFESQPYSSGEIQINKAIDNYTYYQSAADVFNENAVMISSWGGYAAIDNCQLVQTSFKLANLIAQSPASKDEPINDEALKDASNWTAANLNVSCAPARPGFASFPSDVMFAFFYRIMAYDMAPFGLYSFGLTALRYPLNDEDQNKNNQWSPIIQLYEADGAKIPTSAGIYNDISATSVGDNIVIVSCSSAISTDNGEFSNLSGQQAMGTYIGVYDKTKIDLNNNKWKAESSMYLPFEGTDIMNQNTAFKVLIEWYTIVNDNAQLEYNLLILLMTGQADANGFPVINAYTWPFTLNDNSSITLGNLRSIIKSVGNELLRFTTNVASVPFSIADLKRDPAGRLRAWLSFNNKSFIPAYLVVSGDNFIEVTTTSESITPSETSGYSAAPSSSSIYIANDGQYTSKVPATKPDYPDLTATNYPVYEFVYYGEYPKVQVNRIATVQTITDPSDSPRTPKPISGPSYIIGGMIHGPIPLPLVNYLDTDPGSSELNGGTLTYGTDNKQTQERKTSRSLSIGLDVEGKTTKGVGPDVKMSFKNTMGSVHDVSSEFDLVQDLDQKAMVNYDENKKNPVVAREGNIKTLEANYTITAYSYIDNYGSSVISSDGSTSSGLKSGGISMGFRDVSTLNFIPYYVAEFGNLESYTPQAINARMTSLGYDGTKLGYTDKDNYFGDVICRNALPLGGADYLEMTWVENGESTETFTQLTTDCKESNWSFDASLYAGVSGGGGFELFGDGEEFEFSVLAGADMSRDLSVTDESQNEWGIVLHEDWGPLISERADAVSSYIFRIYFQPVPVKPSLLPQTYWTTELLEYINDENLKNQISKTSASWRIMYVVTDIKYKNGKETTYDGSLDKPSVYSGADVK